MSNAQRTDRKSYNEVCGELVSMLIRRDSNFRYAYRSAGRPNVIGSVMADGLYSRSQFFGAWFVVDTLLWEDYDSML